jgi:hypothetical protein
MRKGLYETNKVQRYLDDLLSSSDVKLLSEQDSDPLLIEQISSLKDYLKRIDGNILVYNRDCQKPNFLLQPIVKAFGTEPRWKVSDEDYLVFIEPIKANVVDKPDANMEVYVDVDYVEVKGAINDKTSSPAYDAREDDEIVLVFQSKSKKGQKDVQYLPESSKIAFLDNNGLYLANSTKKSTHETIYLPESVIDEVLYGKPQIAIIPAII